MAISQESSDVRPTWHTSLTIEVVSQNDIKTIFFYDRYTTGDWNSVPEISFAYCLFHLFGGIIDTESIVGASSQLWLVVRIELASTPAV